MDIAVIPAIPSDLPYIDHLQRKNAEELSFYPTSVFEREIENSRIILARVNGEPAGYLYRGAFSGVCRIHQACIEYDLRGQLYGSKLVRHFLDLAKSADVMTVSLRCGSDIAANGFWRSMGFLCETVGPGGVRRMRDINCWRLNIHQPLFITEIEPSSRAQDSSVWRQRTANLGTQFLRGAALRRYRNALVGEDS